MMKASIILFCLCVGLLPAIAADAPPSAADGVQGESARICVVLIHGPIDRAMQAFVRRGIEVAKKNKAGYVIFDIDTFGGGIEPAMGITGLIGSVEPAVSVAYVGTTERGVSWSAGAIIAFSCARIYMAPGTSIGAAAPVYQSNSAMEMAPEKVVSAVRTQFAALAKKNGYPEGIALAMVDMDVELLEVRVDGKLMVVTEDELVNVEREARKAGHEVEVGKTVSAKGKLLTLTADEMEKYGVSSGTIPSRDELCKTLGGENVEVVVLEMSHADHIVSLLTNTSVIVLLIMIALVTLYLEITTPGFGVPGTVSLICFAILLTSNFMLGRAGSVELLMLVLGVVLLIVELLLIPGFGAAGITGMLLIAASLVLTIQDFTVPRFPLQWDMLLANLIIVGVGVLLGFGIAALLAMWLPNIPVLKRLTLTSSEMASEGFTVQPPEASSKMIGQRGVSTTKLRPSGKARFDGNVIVVDTDGEFVDAGQAVEVIEASGNRIVVRKC
jgi:membrane-bound serine protease (ClpP class)